MSGGCHDFLGHWYHDFMGLNSSQSSVFPARVGWTAFERGNVWTPFVQAPVDSRVPGMTGTMTLR